MRGRIVGKMNTYDTPVAKRLRYFMRQVEITQSALARLSKVSQPTIARILAGRTPEPETTTLMKLGRALGDELCLIQDNRDIDIPSLLPRRDDDIIIEQYDAGGRMGCNGLILQDQPGVISSWSVSKDWLRLNVKGWTNASKLCIVTGFGDSMRPMFAPGDPLLVDTSINTVDYDAVYFFRVGNEGFIKRLQRIPGEGLRVLSANRDFYEPWTVKPGMDFEVIGRVLKIWRDDDC